MKGLPNLGDDDEFLQELRTWFENMAPGQEAESEIRDLKQKDYPANELMWEFRRVVEGTPALETLPAAPSDSSGDSKDDLMVDGTLIGGASATLVTELVRLEIDHHWELIRFVVAPKMTQSVILRTQIERMRENKIGTSNESLVIKFILIGLSEYPKAQIILFWFLLMVYLISFLGNGLIIMLIIADPRLHTPMYFFICVLSTVDFILTNNALPEVLVNCFIYRPTISFSRCLVQMYMGLFLIVAECIILAVMAYDRLAAICQPLYYTQIMSWKLCIYLVAMSVALAFMTTLVNVLLQPTDFCGHHTINHFACELQSLLKLACSNRVSELFMHISSFFLLFPPFGFIVVTYIRIGLAIRRISSTQGRRKAFSTCSSHLAVVSVFYGTIMIMYLRPEGKSISEKDKVISLTYGALTPMLNPLIYSLRNKDVKGAFWKLIQRKTLM
ncbi:olfactory receptor 13H1-like [Pantherophis guttatus]|uniref:Olfactory receptor 13H1-like n=1 Tax=Pantherophis guttatus TaxID=94885 RepID=A0ABM3Z776_PANGU|nr:olfactory receptor 13H1-like [Pantherophis guttatus]